MMNKLCDSLDFSNFSSSLLVTPPQENPSCYLDQCSFEGLYPARLAFSQNTVLASFSTQTSSNPSSQQEKKYEQEVPEYTKQDKSLLGQSESSVHIELEEDPLDTFRILSFLGTYDLQKNSEYSSFGDESTQSLSVTSQHGSDVMDGSSLTNDQFFDFNSRYPKKDPRPSQHDTFSLGNRSLHNGFYPPHGGQSNSSAHPVLSRRKVQYCKTRLCPWFFSGRCMMGRNCNYAHGQEELRSRPDLTRTRICPKMDSCTDPSCRFAHYCSELRATEAFYKTKICKFWQQGSCSAGEECRHAHGYKQLRGPAIDVYKTTSNLFNNMHSAQSKDYSTSDISIKHQETDLMDTLAQLLISQAHSLSNDVRRESTIHHSV